MEGKIPINDIEFLSLKGLKDITMLDSDIGLEIISI